MKEYMSAKKLIEAANKEFNIVIGKKGGMKIMKYVRCCLCGCAFDSENQWNAEPVKTGVCCKPCFVNIVIKARRTRPPEFMRGRKNKIYKVVWQENGEYEYTHVFTKTKAEAVEAFREICKKQEVYPDDGSVMFYEI